MTAQARELSATNVTVQERTQDDGLFARAGQRQGLSFLAVLLSWVQPVRAHPAKDRNKPYKKLFAFFALYRLRSIHFMNHSYVGS